MDEKWIKNLAKAEFKNGEWFLENSNKVKEEATSELFDIISILFEKVNWACENYNLYKKNQRSISVIPIKGSDTELPTGFILLKGNVQLKIEQETHVITTTLIKVRDFRKTQKRIHIFEPKIDPFGGLIWVMDKKSIMTHDLIIKRMLVDLCTTSSIEDSQTSQTLNQTNDKRRHLNT